MIKPVFKYGWFSVRPLPLTPGRKTPDYRIENQRSGDLIGTVRWYGPWRQFCFFPEPGSAWSDGCLADVRNFLAELKKQRKEA